MKTQIAHVVNNQIIYVDNISANGLVGLNGNIYIKYIKFAALQVTDQLKDANKLGFNILVKAFTLHILIHELGHMMLRELLLENSIASSPKGKSSIKFEGGY